MTDAIDVMAVGAHPDDVELAAGATLALCVERGYRIGIVHLTRGEMGTRGTPEEREVEARQAARVLGAHELVFLNCGDGGLRTGPDQEDALIDVIRRLRPRLVLGPPESDRHPDHRRGHRLLSDAVFYAGLARRGSGPPHRPKLVLSYMQHHGFPPSLVVDVSTVWERKLAALACYRSQLHSGDAASRDEPATKISSPEFTAAVTGRAQHFGQMIGAAYGEPFRAAGPIAAADPLDLLPAGMP